MIDIYCKLSW